MLRNGSEILVILLLATSSIQNAGGLAASPHSSRRVGRRHANERMKCGGEVAMTDHAVVIAGGGPTGLMLAGELALARVKVVIVERRESHDLAGLRAGGLHIRTLEVLDQRGIADRFISQGQMVRFAPFARITLDISDMPTRHSYFVALLADPCRTHPSRLGRRVGSSHLSGAGSNGFRAARSRGRRRTV